LTLVNRLSELREAALQALSRRTARGAPTTVRDDAKSPGGGARIEATLNPADPSPFAPLHPLVDHIETCGRHCERTLVNIARIYGPQTAVASMAAVCAATLRDMVAADQVSAEDARNLFALCIHETTASTHLSCREQSTAPE
jgi:hypothetical protein